MKINMKSYEKLKEKAHKEKAEISKTDLIKVCCRIANAAAELEDETAGILNASMEMLKVLDEFFPEEEEKKEETDAEKPAEKTEPDKPKQERMVTRTVSNAKGEEVVYYNILYGFGRQDVLEKLYHYEQEEEAPEEKEKMEKDKIKVGDTVKVTEDPMLKGKTGIVRRIYCTNNGKPYVVNFDENFCWTFSDHEIVKVKSKKTPPCIVVYRDGDTVTVKDLETGEEASAVCSKDDTFDLHTGAFIAMSRLTHFDTDIRLMRLKMEHLDSCISDIRMGFGALMGKGYKYPDFDEEEV